MAADQSKSFAKRADDILYGEVAHGAVRAELVKRLVQAFETCHRRALRDQRRERAEAAK